MDPQPRQAMDIVNKSFNPPAAICPQIPSLSPTSSGAFESVPVPLASDARNDDGHEDGALLSENETVEAVANAEGFNDSLYDFSADVSIDTAQFGDLVNDDNVLTASNRASTPVEFDVETTSIDVGVTAVASSSPTPSSTASEYSDRMASDRLTADREAAAKARVWAEANSISSLVVEMHTEILTESFPAISRTASTAARRAREEHQRREKLIDAKEAEAKSRVRTEVEKARSKYTEAARMLEMREAAAKARVQQEAARARDEHTAQCKQREDAALERLKAEAARAKSEHDAEAAAWEVSARARIAEEAAKAKAEHEAQMAERVAEAKRAIADEARRTKAEIARWEAEAMDRVRVAAEAAGVSVPSRAPRQTQPTLSTCDDDEVAETTRAPKRQRRQSSDAAGLSSSSSSDDQPPTPARSSTRRKETPFKLRKDRIVR